MGKNAEIARAPILFNTSVEMGMAETLFNTREYHDVRLMIDRLALSYAADTRDERLICKGSDTALVYGKSSLVWGEFVAVLLYRIQFITRQTWDYIGGYVSEFKTMKKRAPNGKPMWVEVEDSAWVGKFRRVRLGDKTDNPPTHDYFSSRLR